MTRPCAPWASRRLRPSRGRSRRRHACRPRAPRARADQRLRLASDRAVGQHDEAERLTIRSARRAAGGEQHGAQRIRRHRLVAIPADRTGGRQAFEQTELVGRPMVPVRGVIVGVARHDDRRDAATPCNLERRCTTPLRFCRVARASVHPTAARSSRPGFAGRLGASEISCCPRCRIAGELDRRHVGGGACARREPLAGNRQRRTARRPSCRRP